MFFQPGVWGRDSFLKEIPTGTPLLLRREPTNLHDHNAVKILYGEKTIGYIPREIAKKLAPIIDRGCEHECRLKKLVGNKSNPQVIITISTKPIKRLIPPPTLCSGRRGQPITPDTLIGKIFRKHSNHQRWFNNHAEICGIYLIWSKDNKGYVGQSTNIGERWRDHYNKLRARSHDNEKLQAEWTQKGESNFRFDLLEEASLLQLDRLESYYINLLGTYRAGFNLTHDGQARMQKANSLPVQRDNGTAPKIHRPGNSKIDDPAAPAVTITKPEQITPDQCMGGDKITQLKLKNTLTNNVDVAYALTDGLLRSYCTSALVVICFIAWISICLLVNDDDRRNTAEKPNTPHPSYEQQWYAYVYRTNEWIKSTPKWEPLPANSRSGQVKTLPARE